MMRLPPIAACAVVSLLVCTSPYISPVLAQDAPATEPAAPAAAIDPAIRRDVEDFWHYGRIANYKLAVEQAQKIVAQKEKKADILKAFESVSGARKDDLDQWLLKWQGVGEMKDATTQLLNLLAEARTARREDPVYIESNIKDLSTTQRGYLLSIERLRESGELAVPQMIDYLRDAGKRQYHAAIHRALRDLGRMAINPLIAATAMNDQDTLIAVVAALGDIGYDAPVPYLAKLAKGHSSAAVRDAATKALTTMGAGDPQSMAPASLFYDLGERLYYERSSLVADSRNPTAFVWLWTDDRGLTRQAVPHPIFNEIMAMRSAEYALGLDESMGKAISLWLASDYKREAELPQGATDPTRPEGTPNAHYYGVAAGTQYVNSVLARALADRNGAVALKAIKSLNEIAGASNMFADGQSEPLIDALSYPDRQVRIPAALAVAASLPQKSFSGQDRVMPVMAEALSQSSKLMVLVVAPSQEAANALVETMKSNGYDAVGGEGAEAALAATARIPSVDVILFARDLKQSDIDRTASAATQSQKLALAVQLYMVETKSAPIAQTAVNNPMLSVTTGTDAPALKTAVEEARKKAGIIVLDDKQVTEYALRSAQLLGQLALSRGQVLDLSEAQGALLRALDDERVDLVKAAGNALALTDSKDAQVGLAIKATSEKTAEDVKLSIYKSLSTNAKFFGNRLPAEQIDALKKEAEAAKSLEVRSAAAEAHGSLNLPAEEAKKLILNQSRVVPQAAEPK